MLTGASPSSLKQFYRLAQRHNLYNPAPRFGNKAAPLQVLIAQQAVEWLFFQKHLLCFVSATMQFGGINLLSLDEV